MMHVSLYHDILVSAVAYDSDIKDARVHIDVHDGESKFMTPDRVAYLDISPKQARKLASELIAAADRCDAGVKDDATENV